MTARSGFRRGGSARGVAITLCILHEDMPPLPKKRTAGPTDKPGRIRIIGGAYRRTPIAVPDIPGLRPTPDRVRETVFNWLRHLLGGDFAGIRAVDCYAGSGALGFEMASRGASRVVLVEKNARAAEALRELQRKLGAGNVEVVQADWKLAAARLPPASFDVAFLDPPFGAGLLPPALDAVKPLLAPGGIVYAEAADPLTAEALQPLGLELVRADRAGAVHYHLLRRRAS